MPFYSYKCSKCNKKFEVKKLMCENHTPENCPKCHKPAERNLAKDLETLYVADPIKTVGSLADKQGSQFSEDYKKHILDKNKEKNTEPGRVSPWKKVNK